MLMSVLGAPKDIAMKPKILCLLSGHLALTLVTDPATAKEKLSIALNVDPSHAAMTYALRNGKVKSDVVDVDLHFLDVKALTQAASSKRFDILQFSALAVPRAITQGLSMKVLGVSSNGPPGSGRDIWVKKDSPLQKPADLKGKTLGVYSLATGSVTLVALRFQRRRQWRRLHDEADADDGDASRARDRPARCLDAVEHPGLSRGQVR
jgi:NitT/TauT family transport system substrate-binding protein